MNHARIIWLLVTLVNLKFVATYRNYLTNLRLGSLDPFGASDLPSKEFK